MRASVWLALAVALAAGCARSGLLAPSTDDPLEPHAGRGGSASGRAGAQGSAANGGRGGSSTGAGRMGRGARGGRGDSGGIAGFLGLGGTPASGNGGRAGSGPTHAGGTGPDAGEAGAGGEAGTSTVPSCVLYVSQALGNDANQGRSWTHAVATVTRALALAEPGCELWLTSGTYAPTDTDNRKARFRLPRDVALRGGFTGGERVASERSFAGPLPILSGNIGEPAEERDNSYHVVVTDGDATLDHLQIEGGYADDGVNTRGAAIAAAGDLTLDTCALVASYAQGDGGAVAAHGRLTVKDSTFSGNTAGNHGGAIFVDASGPIDVQNTKFEANGAHDGGALYVATSGAPVATSIGNGAFEANGALYAGGAISAEAGASVAVSDSTFDQNTASVASALQSLGPLSLYNSSVTNNQANSDDGGAVHATDATTVTRCAFTNNVGGALVVEPDGGSCSLSVALTGFSTNFGYRGGAIAATTCGVEVTGSNFTDNAVEDYGGAIYADGAAAGSADGLSVASSDFVANSAGIFGGALYASGGDIALTQSNFDGNTAPNGGAVLIEAAGVVTVQSCTFEQNSAASAGGALFTRSTSFTELVDTLVAQNTAATDAAAVYCADAGLRFRNVTVADNVTSGAAAVSALGAVSVVNSIFWNDVPSEFALATASLTSEDPRAPNLVASNLSGTYPTLAAFDPKFVAATSADYRLSAGSPCIDTADDSSAPATDITGYPRVSAHPSPCPTCKGVADMGAYEYHP